MHNLGLFFNRFLMALNQYCTPSHCHHCDTPMDPLLGGHALCDYCENLCTPEPTTIYEKSYAVHALFEFSGAIQTLMHHLKFDCNPAVVKQLLPDSLAIPTADVVIPVPSHPSRIRQRGFDHVERLFKHRYGHRYYPCVQRVKKTPSLYNQPAEKRKKILANAFQWNPQYTHNCNNQSLLILDDIYTSGSTINAMIQCINHHCKPKAIAVFALCRKM